MSLFENIVLGSYTENKDITIRHIQTLREKLQEILDLLESANEGDPTKDTLVELVQKLRWAVKKFPGADIEAIESNRGVKNRSSFRSLKAWLPKTLNSIVENDDPDAANFLDEINQDANSIIRLIEHTKLLEQQISKRFGRTKLAIQSLFLVPIASAFLWTAYNRSITGFEAESILLVNAHDSYDHDAKNDTYDLYDTYEDTLWYEFSRYFFNQTNNFNSLLMNQDEEIKFIIRNQKKERTTLIHNIATEVTFEEEKFDWQRLNVTPNISTSLYIDYDDEDFELGPATYLLVQSLQGPPAKEIKVEIKDKNGTVHSSFQIGKLLFNSFTHDLTQIKDPENWLWQYINDDGTLNNTRYYKMSSIPDVPENGYINTVEFPELGPDVRQQSVYNEAGTELFFDFKGDWYEIIRDSAQIASIAETIVLNKIDVALSYKSVKNESYKRTDAHELERPILYHKKSSDVILKRPSYLRQVLDLTDYDSDGIINMLDQEISSAAFLGAILAPNYTSYEPQGIDMLLDSMTVHLDETGYGFNEYDLQINLNPQGYVIYYVTCENVSGLHGTYKVAFKINHKEEGMLKFRRFWPPISADHIQDYSAVLLDLGDMYGPRPPWNVEQILRDNFDWE